jgi:23S rRNA (guanosine2251-2'-O)-methyltransferase
LEGWISVLAALTAGYRTIHQIYLQQGKYKAEHQLLARYARAAGVPLTYLSQNEVQHFAQSHSHGGAIALVGPRAYQPLSSLPLSSLGEGAQRPFVAMLDGVEDPFNFGQAIRALYAAGAQGLVLRARRWVEAEAVIARASAGASELIPTALVESPLEAVHHFKERGLRIACTGSTPSHQSIYEADLNQPLFLIIGGERRGIMRAVVQEADLHLRIPYGGDFRQSLDITSATAILAFEVLRQRGAGRGPTGELSYV